MEGSISALCRSGAENVEWSNNMLSVASATEPTRLDVSSARMTLLPVMLPALLQTLLVIFPVLPPVVGFSVGPISGGSGTSRFWTSETPDFIGQWDWGVIFLLHKIGYFNRLQ